MDGTRAVTWEGPIVTIAQALQDTTVDVILAGHTHRVSNLMVGHILVADGMNAGASYSVVQMVRPGWKEVEWAGAATRIAKNLGIAKRADFKAIVDDANAKTAILRNQVIGTQPIDILPRPHPFLRVRYGQYGGGRHALEIPGVDGAYTNSGGLRQDLLCTRRRQVSNGRNHLGRDVHRSAFR